MENIRVIVVEDSPIMRHFLSEAIGRTPGFTVVAAAHNASDAWQKIQAEGPDLLTLDVEMPDMDGITFLEKLMCLRPIPVVMVSALTQTGSATTLRALRAGAVDFVAKPEGNASGTTAIWVTELITKLRRAVRVGHTLLASRRDGGRGGMDVAAASRARSARKCSAEVIAVGCGSGDIEALRQLLAALPRDCPPVVVAQRASRVMARAFVEYAGQDCAVRLCVGKDGDPLLRGHVLVCGEEAICSLQRQDRGVCLRLEELSNRRIEAGRAAALFESCVRVAGRLAVGILMESATDDGVAGLMALRRVGGKAILETRAADGAECGPGTEGKFSDIFRLAGVTWDGETLPLERILSALLADTTHID